MSTPVKTKPSREGVSHVLPAEQIPTSVLLAGKMSNLWLLRKLIMLMVKRDLIGRYNGSMLGALWTFVNPLGHMLLYTFVFSLVLKVRFTSDPGTGNFVLFLMAGLLPWTLVSESLARATTVILEQPNLVKRVVFPLEILPLNNVLGSLLTEVIGLSVLILAAIVCTHQVHHSLIFLPLVIASQVLFVAGLSWLFASLGVYIQDLRHLMSLSLSAWMYATPIVYPPTAFPDNLRWLVWCNPMAGIVTDVRRVILLGLPPDWPMFCLYTGIAIAIWFAGHYFFVKTKLSFADVM